MGLERKRGGEPQARRKEGEDINIEIGGWGREGDGDVVVHYVVIPALSLITHTYQCVGGGREHIFKNGL